MEYVTKPNKTFINSYDAQFGEAKYMQKRRQEDTLVLFLLPFWRTLDFGEPIRFVFIDVFGATEQINNHIYIYISTVVPLTLENTKNIEHFCHF